MDIIKTNKKKFKIMGCIIAVLTASLIGINTLSASASSNDDYIIGESNLNNTAENSAKVGDALKEPEIGWKRYDDTDSKILYSGKWTKSVVDSHYKGSQHNTGTAGSTITFKFFGTKLRIISSAGNIYYSSNIPIIIDDKTETFSQLGASAQQKLVYEKSDLNLGIHTVTIQATDASKYVVLDAIDIDESGYLIDQTDTLVSTITLNKTLLNLNVGQTEDLIATVKPDNAENKTVTWSSSDESIATVDENGNVTAVKEGQATIIAKVENTNLTATCEVNVTNPVEVNKNGAILSISLVDGAIKEYDVSMQEVDKFINWFEERSNGNGLELYSFTKKINPYKSVREYIVHNKIASFEVREYEVTE